MKLLHILTAVPLVLYPDSARTQVTPGSDSILARVLRVATDSSHTERLAHSLLDSIGPRLSGTALARSGNDWLVATYRSWGIDARNEAAGTWRGWRRGHSHIDMVFPRQRTLEGSMLGHSPGTGGRDVIAPAIILPKFEDSAAFVRWLPSARGKLVLVSPPKPTCRPVESWVEHGTEASRRRLARALDSVGREWTSRNVRGTGYNLALGTGDLGLRMEKAGIAGMITSRSKDAWGTIEIFETYNTRAPAIALSCEDFGLLFRLAESGTIPRVRVNLEAALLGEQPVFNTVATIRGVSKPDEYVVLSAHFDSFDGASGATDNGTGTIMIMEAMRILKLINPRPSRTIVAGHWIAEEHGLHGSRIFAEDHPEILNGMQVLFNQDNGTGRVLGIDGAGLPDASARLGEWLARLPESLRSQVTHKGPGRPSRGGSDDASFACHGLPAFGLGSLGWDYGSYTWHTNRDTYDKIVFDDLKQNAALVAMLAYLASEDTAFIKRDRAAPQAPAGAPAWPECQKAPRRTAPRLR